MNFDGFANYILHVNITNRNSRYYDNLSFIYRFNLNVVPKKFVHFQPIS